MHWMALWVRFANWGNEHGPKILLTVLVGYAAIQLLRSVTKRIEGYQPSGTDPFLKGIDPQRLQTLAQLVRHAGKVVIAFVVGLLILMEAGINPGPILASAGVLGVAVGFGAQALIKDLFAGTFILVENQFQVGDVIRTGEITGEVEKMTLRVTCLRDIHGNYHVIPNGELHTVTNLSKEWARAVIDIDVAYHEDLDRCLAVVQSTADAWTANNPEKIVDKPEVLGVQALGPSGVTLRLILKTKPLEQWAVERALRKSLKQAFDREGIEIPFRQVTVWQARMPQERE